jgi:hypothetical protein
MEYRDTENAAAKCLLVSLCAPALQAQVSAQGRESAVRVLALSVAPPTILVNGRGLRTDHARQRASEWLCFFLVGPGAVVSVLQPVRRAALIGIPIQIVVTVGLTALAAARVLECLVLLR